MLYNWQQVIPISDSICGSPLLELVSSLSSTAWMLELQMAAGISYRYLHSQCHKLQYGLSSLHSLPSVKFTHTTFQSSLTRAISMYRIRMDAARQLLLRLLLYSPVYVTLLHQFLYLISRFALDQSESITFNLNTFPVYIRTSNGKTILYH